MNQLCKDLQKDGLFAMSLSSKELFHSNFWAWLFERDEEYIRLFFPNFSTQGNYIVKREQGNRDITIWTNTDFGKEKAYVIENKFKSLPNEDQIKGYQKELGDKFEQGIITGIKDPNFNVNRWTYKSCADISKGIKEIAKKENASFEKDLIIKYAEMLDKLVRCIEKELEKDNNCWVSSISDDIIELRLADIVSKLRARTFAEWLSKELDSNSSICRTKNGYHLAINDYYGARAKAGGIDIRYVKTDKKGQVTDVIGIQIEGKQYRKCAQINNSSLKPDDLFEKYRDAGWFETEHSKNSNTSQRKEYGKYVGSGSDKYAFVYQYENITDDNNDYQQLFKKIEEDLKNAVSIL